MLKHRPHEEIPLVLFGIAASVLMASQLVKMGFVSGPAFLALFGSMSSVMVVVRQWRYG